VIVPDLNLLIYAYNEAARAHQSARAWWEDAVASERPIGIPWAVSFGFIRLLTHPSVLEQPVEVQTAVAIVASWLELPNVQALNPGARHLEFARHLFTEVGVGGNLTTDVHIAAIAIEHQAEVHSNDSDFGRFPGLRWHNPLARA